jgi:serine/threonine-protein kinase
MVYLGLGDNSRALDYVEKALEDRRGWLVYLNVNPMFDPLRGDPRFEAVARRMNLHPGSARAR